MRLLRKKGFYWKVAVENNIMKLLPTFKGYIVDEAAQRFRKVTTSKGKPSTYIPFNSSQGQKMRKEFIAYYKFALRKVNNQSKKR